MSFYDNASPAMAPGVRTSSKTAGDSKEAKLKRFAQRKSWFTMELQRQSANRYQMALDEAYYDSEQWTADEKAELAGRGQNPVVYNEIAPMIDFLIGTEQRTRTDYEIMVRNDDSPEAEEDAEVKSKLMKYIEDINKAPFERSQAVAEQFKAGLGWLEAAAIGDPTKMPIRIRSESWRNMLHDSLGRHMLTEDWRYLFRFKDVDFDIADAMLGYKMTDKLRKAVVHYDTRQVSDFMMGGSTMGGMLPSFDDGLPRKWNTFDADAWVNNPRERLMLIECWSTEPYRGMDPKGSTGNMDEPIRMRKRLSVMTEFDTLIEEWSPYKHGRYPFIPLWCYRRAKDGQPYGAIRRHRGPQDFINKHMSKVQFRMSVNQVRLEADALDDEVMDIDELREEVAAPDGILQFAAGALRDKKVEIRDGLEFTEPELRLVAENRASIGRSSGVSNEEQGFGNEVSGKARDIRKEQGATMTAGIFDMQRMARQIEGEIVLSLAEQYNTEPMTFSVPGEIKKREFVKINQPHPDGSGRVLNDISERTAQFIIGEQAWDQALSQASFEAAMDMLGTLSKTAPQVVVSILDIVFELNPHLPKKARILQRIRQATGMPDPDKGPTPEQLAQNQKKEQMSDAQFQAQLQELLAKVAEAKAKGVKLTAEAFAKQLEGLYMAAEAAQIIALAPQLAPVMDELAKSAGFVDMDGPPLVAPMAPGATPMQTAAGQPPPQPGPPIPPPTGGAGPLVGHEMGIHTPQPDGIRPGV